MFAALKSVFGVKEWPEYTREEVAKHNTRESVWLVAGEKVFDVTEFVKLHPAGPVAILKRAGGCADCTQDYKFHSKGAREQWKNCQIGVLTAGELAKPIPATAAPSPAIITAATVPLRYGKEGEQQLLSTSQPDTAVAAALSREMEDDNDGGEDLVAVGSCCRGGAPSDACRNCPNAPRCLRAAKSGSDVAKKGAIANQQPVRIGSV